MATQLANAYVQIIPSTGGMVSGIQSALEDSSKSSGNKAAGGGVASSFVSGFADGVKKGVAALGIGALVGKSISAGADLEQSIGGIETLFGDAASVALENADKAFKTAGLSANDYMQTVTSFAAALKQSTSDEYAAASAADQAVIDMSDNANKMGTDMQSIQNAYQGFAKQNYTMLDNLKLGYGGTKSEMERLLEDAEAISGVHYDIDSLNDVYSAIHVIQGELGITGTTALEASETLSGSLSAMQAAASNLLGKMATGEDVKPAITGLTDAFSTYLFDNFTPMLSNFIGAIPGIMSGFITDGIPKFLECGEQMLRNLIDGISGDEGGEVGRGVGDTISSLISTFTEHLPEILSLGGQLLVKLVEGILGAIPELVKAIPDLVTQFVEGIAEHKDEYIQAGKDLILGLKDGILGGVSAIAEAAKEAAGKALDAAKDFLGIHSPSRVFRDQIGQNIGLGIAEGIDESESAVSRALDGLRDEALGGFDTALSLSAGAYSGIQGEYYEQMNNNIVSAIMQIGTAVIAAINNQEMPSVYIGDRDIFAAASRGARLQGVSLVEV